MAEAEKKKKKERRKCKHEWYLADKWDYEGETFYLFYCKYCLKFKKI